MISQNKKRSQKKEPNMLLPVLVIQELGVPAQVPGHRWHGDSQTACAGCTKRSGMGCSKSTHNYCHMRRCRKCTIQAVFKHGQI